MERTNTCWINVSNTIKSIFILGCMALTAVSCGDDDEETTSDATTESETNCDDLTANAERSAENEIEVTFAGGAAPYAYTVNYDGGATQTGEASESPVKITLTETTDANSVKITDDADCSVTAQLAVCALAATAVVSDGEIALTMTGGSAPYDYVITYTGGSTQEDELSSETGTITADETEDATIVITDGKFCTTEVSITAADLTSFLDARDGERYKMITIGTQTWLAQNFNFDYEGSLCYDNDEANCDTYGKLYTWAMATADDFAPEGWHLPTKDERDALVTEIGDDAVNKLIVGGSSGFEAKFAGSEVDGSYANLGADAFFLTSTKSSDDPERSWIFRIEDDGSVIEVNDASTRVHISVRLIKD